MDHANVVKGLHKSLRQKVRGGMSTEDVWKDLLHNKPVLKIYAHSMNQLAKHEWEKTCTENRILWCRDVCKSYFFDGGMEKMIRKEEKSKMFQQLGDEGSPETPKIVKTISETVKKLDINIPLFNNKLLLLDVGSCFNPFQEFEEFHVFAVDISPAVDDVIQCDFLNISLDPTSDISRYFEESQKNFGLAKDITIALKANKLIPNVFNVVVFSLLLSYFPSSSQRLQCCIKSHAALQINGLLLIVTPDSSHQNRHAEMMKSWKKALESLGFKRYKYEKLQHLHCMAFQKSHKQSPTVTTNLSELIYIPQDFQDNDQVTIDNISCSNEESFDVDLFPDTDLCE